MEREHENKALVIPLNYTHCSAYSIDLNGLSSNARVGGPVWYFSNCEVWRFPLGNSSTQWYKLATTSVY